MSHAVTPILRAPAAGLADLSPVHRGRILGRLARDAAGKFGLRPRAVRMVREGYCTTFRVIDADNRVYALKAGRVGTETVETLRLEAELANCLHQASLTVPEVARAPDGASIVVAEGHEAGARPCVLYRWLPGRRRLGHMDGESARKLGCLLGRIHMAAETFRPSPCDRKTWRVKQMCGWWHGPDPLTNRLNATALECVRAWERRIQSTWERTHRDHNSWGLALADVGPHNVLWHAGSPWLVDFNDTGWGLLAYDLAVLWHSVIDRDIDSGDKVIAGYASVRDLPRGWGSEMRAAATIRVLRHRTTRRRATEPCLRLLRDLTHGRTRSSVR